MLRRVRAIRPTVRPSPGSRLRPPSRRAARTRRATMGCRALRARATSASISTARGAPRPSARNGLSEPEPRPWPRGPRAGFLFSAVSLRIGVRLVLLLLVGVLPVIFLWRVLLLLVAPRGRLAGRLRLVVPVVLPDLPLRGFRSARRRGDAALIAGG